MRSFVAAGVALAVGVGGAGIATAQEPGAAVEPPPVGIIAQGVSIDGIDVGGLTRQAAKAKVLKKRVAPKRRPLAVSVAGKRFAIKPVQVGYRADVAYAVRGAYSFGHTRPLRENMNVPLRERINRSKLRSVLATKGARLAIAPTDAAISFRGTKPVIRKARLGVSLKLAPAERIVSRALLTRKKRSYKLPTQRLRPSRTTHPPAVLIERDRFRLTLFKNGKRNSFTVAVGQPAYPTPVGNFQITSKQRNPTWFPPNSPWAQGIGPVPPGPGNPLGTRWIGTSATAIGIHGTTAPSSLGTRASHGCIRMSVAQSEWLYDQIELGTPVVIR
ncbi:MAG: L,D-transpeptidase family protein [Miltoncostaeaceae bacterium]